MSEGVEFFFAAAILLVVGWCVWQLGRRLVQSRIDRPPKN